MAYQPVTVRPKDGGDLVTRHSLENVGPANYSVKREWRRFNDGEIRREGHVAFAPNSAVSSSSQSVIAGTPIVCIHNSKKSNGDGAVIACTQTAIYRFLSFEDGNVYAIGATQVYATGVYEDASGAWIKIGDNFSSSGNRWEAVDVAGLTIFNNGKDLPVSYDLNDFKVRPLYELREQGIAFVGTIANYNGTLMLADVAELTPDATHSVLVGRTGGSATATQSGTTVTASGATFNANDVGNIIMFESVNSPARILNVISSTVVTVDTIAGIASTNFRVAKMWGPIYDESEYEWDRTQYRILWSDFGKPLNFAASSELNGSSTLGATVIQSFNGMPSIVAGDEIILTGLGVAGSALQTTVLAVDTYYRNFTIADPVPIAPDGTLSYTIQKLDALASLTGSWDVEDDGSSVVKMLELQGRLIVAKDTSFFVGETTGVDATPFAFKKVYNGAHTLFWKNTLISLDGTSVLFASKNGFFMFDIFSYSPKEHEKLSLCRNLFFDAVTDVASTNSVWTANNSVTNEIWIVFPVAATDSAICYDYRFNTCSTVTGVYTAAATIRKPAVNPQTGPTQEWFMLGNSAGSVFNYGLTNLSTGIWTRSGSNYDSLLKSGLIDFQDPFNEKDLRNYVLYLGENVSTPITTAMIGYRNPHESGSTLFTRVIAAPSYKNLIPTFFRKNYYQDSILVTGQSTNATVVGRTFEAGGVDSRSAVRVPAT